MYCKKCGSALNEGVRFCESCGAPAEAQDAAAMPEPPDAPPPPPGNAAYGPQAPYVPVTPAPSPYTPPPPGTPPPYGAGAGPQHYGPGTAVPYGGDDVSPLGTGSFLGYLFLFAIPFVGFIVQLIFAFSQGNINRKNFARAYLLYQVIAIAASILLLIFFGAAFAVLIDSLTYY
jgi:hypothetical protein